MGGSGGVVMTVGVVYWCCGWHCRHVKEAKAKDESTKGKKQS
jgi:hypothetical protein